MVLTAILVPFGWLLPVAHFARVRAAARQRAPLLGRAAVAQLAGRGGSLTSVQSSTPATTGADDDAVVKVRPLLGENHT